MWDNNKTTNELKLKHREIESVNQRFSKNMFNNNKTKQELEIIKCKLDIKDKKTYLSNNNLDNNRLKQEQEQQECQSKSKNIKVLYNVYNDNTMHCETDMKKM